MAAFIVGVVLELAGAGWGAALVFGAIAGWAVIAHVRREMAAGRLIALDRAWQLDARAHGARVTRR
jgi:hypothetical protein